MEDIRFVLRELADLQAICQLPGYDETNPELVDAVLEEAARFAADVMAPLNRIGDSVGARYADGVVTMPPGFREAYRQYVEAGWGTLSAPQEFGGQGLPRLVFATVQEMWKSANMSLSACILLTQGAVEALLLAGSEDQKRTYLPKMIRGEWTGTMNLTEPQAGSDLSAIRTRAVRQPDGRYRIFGQKIFITYCEHDLAENIVHLVLARTPDAPAGVKGISLFLVPKMLVGSDGTLGQRNDLRCVSIEHKLGFHAAPTGVMAFGEKHGAWGSLVGEENRGLEYMFVMMNAARFAVGLEGLGLAERAYQQARDYARARIQGRVQGKGQGAVAIIEHPDVRRMLMLMKSQTEAMRALDYSVAAALDLAHQHENPAERTRHQSFVDLMIPVVKGWGTETGIKVANLGIQVHGGMGYIEETGASQYLRDARGTAIYEGTTGIQASDLVGRKVARDQGCALGALIQQMRVVEQELRESDHQHCQEIASRLCGAIGAVEQAGRFIVENYRAHPDFVAAGAVPFLELLGIAVGGWQLARAALACLNVRCEQSPQFTADKIATACFYSEHILNQAPGLAQTIIAGGATALVLAADRL